MVDLGERVTNYLLNQGEISKEEVNIYRYGISIAIETIINIVFLLITGGLMKHFVAAILFIIVFISVRLYTGGYHADTRAGCVISTVLSLVVNIKLSELVIASGNLLWYFIAAALFTIIVVYVRAPVRNANKVLEEDEVVIYHRKALMLVSFFVVISGFCYVVDRLEAVYICTTLLEISLMIIICRRC